MSTTRTEPSSTNRRQIEARSESPVLPHADSALPVIVIRASDTVRTSLLRDAYRYRELLAFLVWRDIKVRYKQTLLGGAWAILQPLLTMAIFSVVFGRLAGIPSDGVPYPLFVYAALVPWTYFSTAVALSSNSLVDQERLLTKVYFPRMLMPAAPVAGGVLDLSIAFSLLVGIQAFYGITPGWSVVLLPLFILMAVASALGIGLWLSALNVEFRDVRYVIPFLLQVLLFASPVAYSSSLVPERWRYLAGLNPMAGVIEGFRWTLFDLDNPSLSLIAVSLATVTLLLATGAVYFGRMERTFADRI